LGATRRGATGPAKKWREGRGRWEGKGKNKENTAKDMQKKSKQHTHKDTSKKKKSKQAFRRMCTHQHTTKKKTKNITADITTHTKQSLVGCWDL
jgi:hypothetical protein